MDFWIKFILILMCVTATDICWTLYIIKVAEKKALAAGVWGAMISFMTSITVIAYTEDHKFVFAMILGAFIGTIVAVKYMENKVNENQ